MKRCLYIRKNKESSKFKSVHKLKEEIEKLDDVMLLIEDFERLMPPKLQTASDDHKEFMLSLDKGSREDIMKGILGIKKIQSNLRLSGINEKLSILAYSLGVLKVTTLSKDFKQSRRLMNKFLVQDGLSISSILGEIQEFEDYIKQLRSSYLRIHNNISSLHNDLEDKAGIEFNNSAIRKLDSLNKKHKYLLTEIGNEFTSISRQLLKDKDYREVLKKK